METPRLGSGANPYRQPGWSSRGPESLATSSDESGVMAVVVAASGSSGAGGQPSGSAGIPPAPRTEKLPTRSPLLRAAQRSRICEAAFEATAINSVKQR